MNVRLGLGDHRRKLAATAAAIVPSVSGALAAKTGRLLRMSSWSARLSSAMTTRRCLGPVASASTAVMEKRSSCATDFVARPCRAPRFAGGWQRVAADGYYVKIHEENSLVFPRSGHGADSTGYTCRGDPQASAGLSLAYSAGQGARRGAAAGRMAYGSLKTDSAAARHLGSRERSQSTTLVWNG